MATIKIQEPSATQQLFLLDEHKHIGFGGARGGGKSWSVRTKAVLLCLHYAGIKCGIIRRTYPELVENHIRELRLQLLGIARYNDKDKVITFPNGSMIKFGYCANDGDLDRYQGTEFDILFLDEATQFKEEWIRKLTACVRGANSFPKRIYYTCNPGGVGHGYIKRLFIDKKYEGNERPEDYSFIQSKVTDNHALMESNPDYIAQLEALPPHLREMWLEGKWDIYAGQFFEDFRAEPDKRKCEAAGISPEQARHDRRFTHVIEPFDIPSHWRVYRSYDFGYAKPFSCAWWAVDMEGRIYRILELYGCTKTPNEGVKWTPDQQFAAIREMEENHRWLKGRTIRGVADPAIWDASRGESINETALKAHIYFDKGDNRRIPGWMQMHYRLAFDEEGYPMMYIFSNCEAFIRTIPLLMYDEHKPEDLDTSQEDHVADETRYFCMSRPIKPKLQVEREPVVYDPLATEDYTAGQYDWYRRY